MMLRFDLHKVVVVCSNCWIFAGPRCINQEEGAGAKFCVGQCQQHPHHDEGAAAVPRADGSRVQGTVFLQHCTCGGEVFPQQTMASGYSSQSFGSG